LLSRQLASFRNGSLTVPNILVKKLAIINIA
jgi:hypothetical protein